MRRLFASALLCSCFTAFSAHAEQELILSAGKGLNDALLQQNSIASAEMLGASYSKRIAEHLKGPGLWQWWLQGSYSRMREEHEGKIQHQNIFELKPVLRWYPQPASEGLFAEAGVGGAYLTRYSFGAIDLSTKLNFALHFAAGYRLPGGSAMSLRYSHFSNAYTNTPNQGFDFASFNWHISY